MRRFCKALFLLLEQSIGKQSIEFTEAVFVNTHNASPSIVVVRLVDFRVFTLVGLVKLDAAGDKNVGDGNSPLPLPVLPMVAVDHGQNWQRKIKPIRNTVFNFNKLVSDLDIHANTPES